ncbi:MAG: hypothetical protein LBR32_06515 [Propionibacteriaceae bacterium]|nr:hypothetical protein [Propionibacteriaceae bacterium]
MRDLTAGRLTGLLSGMKIPRILLAGLAALVCAVLGLCGCSGESASMRMLEGDPMAAEDLLGLTLVKTEKFPPPRALKAASPTIDHWFAPAAGTTPEETMAQLVAFAKTHGYSTFPDSTTSEMWVGTRLMDPATVMAAVSVDTEASESSSLRTVKVALHFL